MVGAKSARWWELDAARGVAIVCMVAYHLLFDAWWLGFVDVNLSEWWWRLLQMMVAGLFLVLVGMGLYLKYQKLILLHKTNQYIWLVFGGRAGWLALWAGVITLLTWWGFPQLAILFGVLHCIALCTLLSVPVLMIQKWRHWQLLVVALAAGSFLGGGFMTSLTSSTNWWIWLGLKPAHFASLDYFPIFPWLGVVLSGIVIASKIYPEGQRREFFSKWSPPDFFAPLLWCGQYSLVIYLLHQPLLFFSMWLGKTVLQ